MSLRPLVLWAPSSLFFSARLWSSSPPIDRHFLHSLDNVFNHLEPLLFHCIHQEEANEVSESPPSVSSSSATGTWDTGRSLRTPRDSFIPLACCFYKRMVSTLRWLSILIVFHSFQHLCASPLGSDLLHLLFPRTVFSSAYCHASRKREEKPASPSAATRTCARTFGLSQWKGRPSCS